MNKADVLTIVRKLPFDQRDFWVVAGSAACIYELRPETGDVDLGCTSRLADLLEEKGVVPTFLSDGTRKFAFSADVEIYENFLFDRVQMVEDVPVITLQGLLQMKRFLGRKKDLKDIQAIERRLNDFGRSTH